MSKIKTADEIIANAAYEVPVPKLIPVNQRVLCISVDPGEVKTESGIILPGQKTEFDEDNTISQLPRFIVASAADDAVFITTRGSYKLRHGDEVYPFWPPDAIGFTFPIVFDYATGKYFTTFHISELVGFIPAIPKKEKEE